MIFELKKNDLPILGFITLVLLSNLFLPQLFASYLSFNSVHGLIASFIKFAILATFGESLALRISRGIYYEKGFGLLSRAFVWGVLGIIIKLVFILFATGMPNVITYMNNTTLVLAHNNVFNRLVTAFSISLALNVFFSPWLFIVHSITNEHIRRCDGNFKTFFSPIQCHDIIVNLNWAVIWNFSIKKTIPFFWIPAHTLTFVLPPDHQILAAALLSVALGIILAFAKFEGANYKGLVMPLLKKLAAETKCTALFGQIRGDYVYHVAQHEIKANLKLSLNPGQRFPINYGAHGKIILAFSSQEERKKILDQGEINFLNSDVKLPLNGIVTSSDPKQDAPLDLVGLKTELQKCKDDGFAFAKSRAFPGINAISAPVFEASGKLIGCILMLGAFTDQKIQEYGETAKKTAQELSAKLKS
jgi:DNA-binding IclR family transcriptional regulator